MAIAPAESWLSPSANFISMLRLTEEIHEQIKRHGANSYPYEGCGVLLGRMENGHNLVTGIRTMNNVWPVEEEKPERFRIDENEWRDAEFAAMAEGIDIIGIFHSHPDCEPVASPRDLNWASWPGYSYVITEVREGTPTLSRSWQLAPDRSGFREEEIEISAG